jgi:hypothetical protein
LSAAKYWWRSTGRQFECLWSSFEATVSDKPNQAVVVDYDALRFAIQRLTQRMCPKEFGVGATSTA